LAVDFDTDKFDNGTISNNAYYFAYKGTTTPTTATEIDCGVIYDVNNDNSTKVIIGTDGCK